MSNTKNYRIRCPKCSVEQDVELYESVNVLTDPQLREALLKNRLNAVTCKECGFSFRVDKPVLYADPQRQMLIYWFPAEEEDYDRDEGRFIDLLKDMAALMPEDMQSLQVSLVFRRTELIEKIFIREADLDERIVEYIKYTMYTNNPGKLDPADKHLLFNAHDSNEKTLLFVVQDVDTGKLEAMLQYDRQGYEALKEMFSSEAAVIDLLELFSGPYISARHTLLREVETEDEEETDEGTTQSGADTIAPAGDDED